MFPIVVNPNNNLKIVSYDEILKFHVIPMYIAWMICIPFAIIVARLGSRWNLWFPIHTILNVSAFIIILFAATYGIQFSQYHHFVNAHQILGFITLILFIMQLLLGITIGFIMHRFHWDNIIFPKTHWWMGRLIMLLAFTSIFLGMLWLDFNIWIFLVIASTMLLYTIIYVIIIIFSI